MDPTGTVGAPVITDLSFTIEVTGISEDNVTVELLSSGGTQLVTSGDLGTTRTYTINHTESTGGTYNYTVRLTDAAGNTTDYAVSGVVLFAPTFSGAILQFVNMGSSLTDSINGKTFTTVAGTPDYDSVNNALVNSSDKFFLTFTDLRARAEAITVLYELYVPSGSDRTKSLAVGADGSGQTADSFSWYEADTMHIPFGGTPAIDSSYTSSNFPDEWVKLAYIREASGSSVRFFVNGVLVGTVSPSGDNTNLTSDGVVSELRLFYHTWYGTDQVSPYSVKIRNIEVYAASFTDAQMLAALS